MLVKYGIVISMEIPSMKLVSKSSIRNQLVNPMAHLSQVCGCLGGQLPQPQPLPPPRRHLRHLVVAGLPRGAAGRVGDGGATAGGAVDVVEGI